MEQHLPITIQFKKYLVYTIDCSGCDRLYVKQKKQHSKNRFYQHKMTTIMTDIKTALAARTFNTGHLNLTPSVCILDHENNYYKRTVSEMLHIKNIIQFISKTI